VKFTNESTWVTRDGDVLLPDRELIATAITRVTQKWIDRLPVETRVLEPGENFPDLEALNEAAPKSEWAEGPDGKKRGPHQNAYNVHLLDPRTMDRFTFATGTVGGGICTRDLRDKTQWMRRLRGHNVVPVVTLSDKTMKTKFGSRHRPHFVVVRWIELGGGDATAALPAPGAVVEVEAPSLAEEMNDSIGF
jgi:hypothetical protein